MVNDIEQRLSESKAELVKIKKDHNIFFSKHLIWNKRNFIQPSVSTRLNFDHLGNALRVCRDTVIYFNKIDKNIKTSIAKNNLTNAFESINLFCNKNLKAELELFKGEFIFLNKYKNQFENIKTNDELEKFLFELYRNEYSIRFTTFNIGILSALIIEDLELYLAAASANDNDLKLVDTSNILDVIESCNEDLEKIARLYKNLSSTIKTKLPQLKESFINVGIEHSNKSVREASSATNKLEVPDTTITTKIDPLFDLNKTTPSERANNTANYTIFKNSVTTIEIKSILLATKAQNNPNYNKATAAANILIESLNKIGKDFFENENENENENINDKEFKSQCQKAIEKARPELELHRGWSEFLSNLAFVVVSIVTIGIAPLASKIVTGDYRFFKVPQTETAKILDNLKFALEINAALEYN